MDIKSRLRNYGLWVSIAAFGLLIVQTFGVDITPDKWDGITNAVLEILVLLGVINNPTTSTKGFGDDK